MVTEVTVRVLEADYFAAWLSGFGIVLIALLVLLLVQKEYLRGLNGPRAKLWLPTLDVTIMPLMVAFGFFLFFRLLDLLYSA
jgi:hypothetical protein